MDMDVVFRKPRLLRALSSLEADEFTRLLAAFEQEGQARRGRFNRFGPERQRAPGATGNAGVLSPPTARLFFVLFYFKCYPLQEVMGVLSGLSQPQGCLWIGRLTPLVNAALGRERVLPARRPADLETLLAEVPEWRRLVIDEAERPIRRPKNKPRKKDDDRGKKKAHRKKNLLVSSEKRVVYLGPTSAGSVHDKKAGRRKWADLPVRCPGVKDTGFQGCEPPDPPTLQPRKKPRGRELHPIPKTINEIISRVRVTVEHAIAGVKRCRLAADTFRHWRAGMVDEVMLAASGLHNLRVAART